MVTTNKAKEYYYVKKEKNYEMYRIFDSFLIYELLHFTSVYIMKLVIFRLDEVTLTDDGRTDKDRKKNSVSGTGPLHSPM